MPVSMMPSASVRHTASICCLVYLGLNVEHFEIDPRDSGRAEPEARPARRSDAATSLAPVVFCAPSEMAIDAADVRVDALHFGAVEDLAPRRATLKVARRDADHALNPSDDDRCRRSATLAVGVTVVPPRCRTSPALSVAPPVPPAVGCKNRLLTDADVLHVAAHVDARLAIRLNRRCRPARARCCSLIAPTRRRPASLPEELSCAGSTYDFDRRRQRAAGVDVRDARELARDPERVGC